MYCIVIFIIYKQMAIFSNIIKEQQMKGKEQSNRDSENFRKLPVYLLLIISFIEGGSVMVVELLGAKIIAPYYGTSLYVWSSVLGITLGALALGYFIGGQISRKSPGENSLFFVLLLGGFFTVIAPLIAPKILLLTDPLGVRLGSLVSVLLYLLVPIMCLGSVSPIIIQLIIKTQKEAGKSAGTVYAISTVGGILATFLSGFYLIPEIGIKITAYLTGGLLATIAVIYFLANRKFNLGLITAIMVLVVGILSPTPKTSENTRVVYSSTGVLGEWTVLDFGQWQVKDNNQIERKLLLNGIDQTYTQIGFEPLSLWKYPHKIAAYASMKPEGSKALLLGMGGGSIAYELLAMGLELDIVELDGRINYIAEKYFNYDPKTSNLYIDDARHYIRTTNEKYDVVVIDLVLGEVQPAHVFSFEGFKDLRKIINDDAFVIINFQGNLYEAEHSLGPRSIFKTLEEAGYYVDYYTRPTPSGKEISFTNDIFFIASPQKHNFNKLMETLRYNEWFPYENFYYEDLVVERDIDLSEALVLVDNKPKLELLNSINVIHWRQNKIEDNISKMLKEGVNIYN